jgi:hypothetical protein
MSAKRSLYSPFCPPHDGSEQEKFRVRWEGEDAKDDLLARLSRDRSLTGGTMPLPDSGVQHAKIIVNLRDRAPKRGEGERGLRPAVFC